MLISRRILVLFNTLYMHKLAFTILSVEKATFICLFTKAIIYKISCIAINISLRVVKLIIDFQA